MATEESLLLGPASAGKYIITTLEMFARLSRSTVGRGVAGMLKNTNNSRNYFSHWTFLIGRKSSWLPFP